MNLIMLKTYDSIEKFKLVYHSGKIEFPVFIKPINGSGKSAVENKR